MHFTNIASFIITSHWQRHSTLSRPTCIRIPSLRHLAAQKKRAFPQWLLFLSGTNARVCRNFRPVLFQNMRLRSGAVTVRVPSVNYATAVTANAIHTDAFEVEGNGPRRVLAACKPPFKTVMAMCIL